MTGKIGCHSGASGESLLIQNKRQRDSWHCNRIETALKRCSATTALRNFPALHDGHHNFNSCVENFVEKNDWSCLARAKQSAWCCLHKDEANSPEMNSHVNRHNSF